MPMQFLKQLFTAVLTLAFSMTMLHAENIKGDNIHTRTWNKFADDILLLHKKTAAHKELTVTKKTGGYRGQTDFYIEEIHMEEGTNNVISLIQWEKENPDKVHTIEHYVYNNKGQVIRDYAAAYLPTYRNAPTQTLLSFHGYNGKLHAFRTFDASGARIVERCTGTHKGKMVDFILDEDEIYGSLDGDYDLMKQPEYIACFKGIPEEAGKYLTPQ